MSAYKTRIEKVLAGLSIKSNLKKNIMYNRGAYDDAGLTGAEEFTLTKVEYNVSGRCCELCGHNPIKRVFVIENNDTKKEIRIGSSCATNYASADIVSGMAKLLDTEYLKRTNAIKYEEELELLERVYNDRFFAEAKWAFNTITGSFIHAGSVRPLIRKIKEGKRIGKKEKAVITFYKTIDDNREGLEVVKAAFNFFKIDGVCQSPMMRDYYAKRKIAADREAVASVLRAVSFSAKLALEGVCTFFERAGSLGTKAPTEYGIPELLAVIEKKNTFIRSLERQYNTKGYLSPRQESSLKCTVAFGEKASMVLDPLFADTKVGTNGEIFESFRSYYETKGKLTFKQARAISRYFA